MLQRVRSWDVVTKVGLIILLMMILYILFLFVLKPVFIQEAIPSHRTVMGDHLMMFVNADERNLNVTAIVLAFVGGFAVWLLVRGRGAVVPVAAAVRREDHWEVLRKALSADEKRVVEEVEKAGEITQDSLRFRLSWSKAKVSAVLLQLDRMGVVQRVRQGKTYSVVLQKKF